jgi:hypothetical protein
MTLTNSFPAHAEPLDLFAHLKHDREPSKYAPGAMKLRLVLICAACKADLGTVRFEETVKCDCGLSSHATFSRVHIWRDDVLATVPAMAAEV